MTHDERIKVTVHYMAAERPFRDEVKADEAEGNFKQTALSAFGLTEGQTPDGNTVTYTLYHDGRPLENPDETIGRIAEGRDHLQLKLSQQIVQG
jgi:hypothetical protein